MKNRNVAASFGLAFSAVALCGLVMAPGLALAEGSAPASQKDETVYVHTTADGTVTSEDVTTILKNPDGASELSDSSTLSDIEGKDDVTYTENGSSIVWNAEGNDVTYTGTATGEAPVSVRISYTLDGSYIDPSQLAGKSGRVTIRYDFENHSIATATVNGASQTIYTPFTCITALMFDGKDFKNVEVENGKVVNDGDDVIVAGYAMPGLKQSLGSMADDADVPDHFTVTADVTDFELKSSMTIVTAGLMSDIDTESLGFSNLDDASALTDAMGQLIDGSSTLASGLEEMASDSKQLEAGVSGMQEGAQAISNGLYALAGDDGLGKLNSGARRFYDGISLISVSAGELKAKLSEAKGKLALLPEADPFAAAQTILDKHKDALDTDYEALKQAMTTGSTMYGLVAGLSQGLDDAIVSLDGLSAKLDEAKQSASDLAAGANDAIDGAKGLAYAASELEDGAAQLAMAMPKLTEAMRAAADGSKQLTEGMRAFNDQGVSQLVDTLRNDYGGLLDRMNALSDAAKSYTNFGGITPGTTGSVKFVIETDGITKD